MINKSIERLTTKINNSKQYLEEEEIEVNEAIEAMITIADSQSLIMILREEDYV